MEITPWEDIIITEDAPEEVTDQGVVLPGSVADDPNKRPDKGVVVAIGKPSDTKHKLPIELKKGDIIFFERYTKNPVNHKGQVYNFVRFKYVMGALRV